jgi:hypothetical protein
MPKSRLFSSLFAILVVAAGSAYGDDQAALQKKLVAEFALTQPTAANDDIVTAGAILVLGKSDLVLGPTSSSSSLYTNVYKEGKIQANSFAQAKKRLGGIGRIGSLIPGVGGAASGLASGADSNSGAAPRTYVKGEKMWVTKIDVKMEDKQPVVVFELFTDAVNDVRYKGSLKFPYPKGSTDDQVDKLVAEVFTVQPQDDAKDKAAPAAGGAAAPAQAAQTPAASAAAPAAPAAPAAEAVPDIPPPPPPADQPAPPPTTISIGQTPDQVIAALGQPEKIVKLAKKETYYYKDLKVIFTGGKVSDVQ